MSAWPAARQFLPGRVLDVGRMAAEMTLLVMLAVQNLRLRQPVRGCVSDGDIGNREAH
jgi:hypothetical protein